MSPKEAGGKSPAAMKGAGGTRTKRADGKGTDDLPEDKRLKAQFREDREKVQKPLVAHLRGIQKGAKALERDIPMGRIARMQLDGLFLPARHQALWEDSRAVLTVCRDYVEHYWTLQGKIAREFDAQMKREGIHNETAKEYVSLRNSVAEAVILDNGKYWSLSFDTYMPKLREGGRRPKGEPRDGARMFSDLGEMFEPELKRLKSLQKKVGVMSRLLEGKVRRRRWNSPPYRAGL